MDKKNIANTEIRNLQLQEIVDHIKGSSPDESARIIEKLVEEEQALSRMNLLKAYDDTVPLVLQSLDMSGMVNILNQMNDYYLMKALFGNFRAVDDGTRVKILGELSEKKLVPLLKRMSVGVDSPKMAADMLAKLDLSRARAVVNGSDDKVLIRLFEEMDVEDKVRIMEGSNAKRTARILKSYLDNHNVVRLAWVCNILQKMGKSGRDQILNHMDNTHRKPLENQLCKKYVGDLERMDPKEAIGFISDMKPMDAAKKLIEANPEKIAEILKLIEAQTAAAVLTVIAKEGTKLAVDILEEINTKIIVGFKKTERAMQIVEEVYMCPSSAIMEMMDFNIPENLAVLKQMKKPELQLNLERMSEVKKAQIMTLKAQGVTIELPISVQLFSAGSGTKQISKLDHGLKWTRIEEILDTGEKTKPVLIDLVEMNPEKVIIKACRAITKDNSVPMNEIAKIFGDAKREGRRPDTQVFNKLGLIQLSKVVKQKGAIAAINGNHYFDYGHYMDAIKLGIDFTIVPGIFFGDPVGWFVADGEEVSPPCFNRAGFIVTKDGKVHIEKVFMTSVTLNNGVKIDWDGINRKKAAAKTILYNSLFGFKTARSHSHVDIAIARGRISNIADNGDAFIPLTGFILSIPRENRGRILDGVNVGDKVTVTNNFPTSLGEVEQAMACGPHLVRNGQLDISFKAEDFGEKDSSVMSFSLTRAVETFEAARSFMMLRDGRLSIGTVGGTALGSGVPVESGGMTFGELAQLAMDLRADHAYALDGGGSSSIAVLDKGEVKCLTIPTGGSDVAKGEERFINTYWMFFER